MSVSLTFKSKSIPCKTLGLKCNIKIWQISIFNWIQFRRNWQICATNLVCSIILRYVWNTLLYCRANTNCYLWSEEKWLKLYDNSRYRFFSFAQNDIFRYRCLGFLQLLSLSLSCFLSAIEIGKKSHMQANRSNNRKQLLDTHQINSSYKLVKLATCTNIASISHNI